MGQAEIPQRILLRDRMVLIRLSIVVVEIPTYEDYQGGCPESFHSS